ncbi:MAG: 1,6-anhydro-N-acetylmuramyl-L-alanine amidase AmpD [Casimicrobium sp.]
MRNPELAAEWGLGWWRAADRAQCVNYDARPTDTAPELIVLHHISLPAGNFTGTTVLDFFANRLNVSEHPELSPLADLRVSAHFFVRRNGDVFQLVSVDDRAWHAGVSVWRGRDRCNDFSIGIEIEGDAIAPFEAVQYEALNRLLPSLCAAYPIRAVTTHSEIAPGRKVDPGPTFDWARLARRWPL